jgi:nitric oxide reductase NorQ protein
MLYIDSLAESIAAPASFQLVMSYNPGYQKSFKELKASTRQRFVALAFDYPSPEVEALVVMKESGAEEKICKNLVALATKIRTLSELGLAESVSTRLLVNAAILIKQGLNPRHAANVAIAQALTDEADSTRALKDLSALYL